MRGRRRHRHRQDRHRGGRQGPDPAAGRRQRRRAEPGPAGHRRAAGPGGRARAAGDVRAEPQEGLGRAGARPACRGSAIPPRPTSSASSCRTPNLETRRLAIEGLGRVADASMLPAFKKDYQRERSEELRLAYSFALTLLGDRAFLDSLVLVPALAHPGQPLPGLHPGDGPLHLGRALPLPERSGGEHPGLALRPPGPDRRSRGHPAPAAPHQRSEHHRWPIGPTAPWSG